MRLQHFEINKSIYIREKGDGTYDDRERSKNYTNKLDKTQ